MALLVRLVLIVGLLLPGAAVADQPDIPFGEGLLFRIERPGQRPSHVFGTMHVADPAVTTLPDSVRAALRGARNVALEIVWDGATEDYLDRAVMLPPDQALVDLIGPELFARVIDRAGRIGIDTEKLQRLKPWAIAVFVSFDLARYQRVPLGQRILDDLLRNEAGADGKQVYGLETPAEHFAPFERLSDDQERQLLERALEDDDALDTIADMKAMYLAGDLAGLYRQAEAAPAEMRDLMRVLNRYLLVDRNHRMLARMETLFAAGDAFVAVGALHLPGDEGVLRLLEQRGYRVTQVY